MIPNPEMNPKPKANLAAFAKTPELSPVKTRLAADVGEGPALAAYERSLAATAAVLRALPEWIAPHWAVGERAGLNHPRWRDGEFPAMFTGEGGLGERLANVYAKLRGENLPAILIGTDSPQLAPEIVARAAELSRGRIVIGPSADGGFYLFASSLEIPRGVWTGVEYSRAETLRDLERKLPPAEVHRLPELCDLDDAESLPRVMRELESAPLPEQRAMAQWLASSLSAN